MQEIYRALQELAGRKGRGALATVVRTRGSTPRKTAAKMLVLSSGEMVGTIGGGCVEAEVWQQAKEVMRTGEPRLFTYSLTADLAADSGMICGGIMDLFIEPVGIQAGGTETGAGERRGDPTIESLDPLLEGLGRGETLVVATVLRSDSAGVKPGARLLVRQDGAAVGSLAGTPLEEPLVEDARAMVRQGGGSHVGRYGLGDGDQPEAAAEVFLEVVRRQPRLVVVGAGHIGVYVCRIAKVVGFHVIVVDDRADFANPERLPEADQVIAGDLEDALSRLQLDGGSYVVLVTRGHKQDEVALRQVVNSPAAYVGMIGSRTRVRTVKERLIQEGIDRAAVDAVYAPIGLNLGAESPEEIALSIVAEMVKVMRGGDAESLRDRAGRRVAARD